MRMRTPTTKRIGVVAVAIAMIAGVGFAVYQSFLKPMTIVAYFASATAIYPGDEVRVVGVRVGSIEAIEPLGTRTRIVLQVDRDVPVPADAKAIIVAPNLV